MGTANRVAVNTLVQYIQLVANVLIGLFTVRIILNSLGATDYGIYNLIGGVITLITFIRDSLSQTSIRFISVSIGKGNVSEIKNVFRSCFWLHLYMAIALALVLEIVGLFLFDGFLNIPAERIFSAKIVYHCMVLTLFLNILRTPFSGMLIAHEKFLFTSCIGISDSILKLAIAFAVASTSFDKLALYGFLMAGIVALDIFIYICYNLYHYKPLLSFEKVGVKNMGEMFGFAGWTMMDVLGSVVNRQGYAIMLNKFFGPVMNAVYALAGQVEGHLYSISSSAINTMKPQVMKSYGSGDIERTIRLSLTAGKFGFSMMALVSVPLLVMMPDVLALWLKEVPDGTVLFARLMVTACMFEQLTRGLVHANQALGKIKWFSIVVSGVRALALPVSIIALLLGAEAYVAMIIFLIFETLGSSSRVVVMSRISTLSPKTFINSVFFQILPPFLISLIVSIILYRFLNGIVGMIVVSIFTALIYAAVMYLIGLTKEEKSTIQSVLKSVLVKLRFAK